MLTQGDSLFFEFLKALSRVGRLDVPHFERLQILVLDALDVAEPSLECGSILTCVARQRGSQCRSLSNGLLKYFAAGVIFGLLDGRSFEDALEIGVAHAVLSMTTVGDTSSSSLDEINQLIAGNGSSIQR